MDARTEKQQDSDRVVYEYQTIKQIVLQIMSEHENVGGIPVDMPEYQTSCIEDNMNAAETYTDLVFRISEMLIKFINIIFVFE